MQETQHYTFTWNSGHLAIDIEIAFTPNLHIFDHLGIHAVWPSGSKLSIAGTGYRSHYAAAGAVAEAGGAIAAVRILLDEAAAAPEWQEHIKGQLQGSLF